MSRLLARATVVALAALTIFAATAHRADAYVVDGEWDCDGGFYSVYSNTYAGGQVVWCLGAPAGHRGWMRVATTPSTPRAAEGADGASTAVTLSLTRADMGSTPLPLRVRTSGGTATAGVDYDPLDTIVLVPRYGTTITTTLHVRGDDVLEDDETVGIVAEPIGWTAGRDTVKAGGTTVAIVDDEPGTATDEGVAACDGPGHLTTWNGQSVVSCDGSVAGNGTFAFTAEPDGPVVEQRFDEAAATFTIRRAQARTAAPVHFETDGLTATAGTDFAPIAGDVLFRAGETERTVRVAIPRDENYRNGDPSDTYAEDVEAPETLRLVLSSAGPTVATTSSAGLTIYDSDITPRALATPTVTGLAAAGITLQATDGTWLNGLFATRQWQRCDGAGGSCVAIPGATGPTYEASPADVGATLRVAVKADGPGAFTSPATPRTTTTPSTATAQVAALLASPTFTTAPSGTLPTGSDARFEVAGVLSGATLECRVDGGTWTACAADRTVTGLGAGPHTYAVRQRLENATSAEVERAFSIAAPVTPPDPVDPDPVDPDEHEPVEEPSGSGETPVVKTPVEATPREAVVAGPPTPSAPTPAATSAPAPAPTPFVRAETARRLTTAVSPGGVRIGAWCAQRCTLAATLTVSATDARRLGLKTRTIGRAAGSAPAASRARLQVRFGTGARRALRRAAKPVKVTVTYAGAGAPRQTVLVLRP